MPDQTPSMKTARHLVPHDDGPGPWKAGNEFLPYHPSASHVRPDYRDGWNHCYAAAQAVADERVRAERLAAKADARRYRQFFDSGLPITFEGVEYRSKADLDAAMDAARSTLSLGPSK